MPKKRVRSKESRAASRANEQRKRKQERDRKRIEKLTVPREGACEEVVACMVSKAITQVKRGAAHRRIAREKREELKLTDPEALRAKTKKGNDELRDAAKREGVTQAELSARRKEARKDKPKFNDTNYRKQPHPNPCPPLACSPAFPCSSTELTYKEGGPAAEARFDAGVAGFEARAFRGCGVFTSGAPAPAPAHQRLATTACQRSPLHLFVRVQSRLKSAMTPTRCRCSRVRARLASSTS